MLVPLPESGTSSTIDLSNQTWLKDLKGKVWFDLWLRWPTHDLPTGYELYVTSFHLEAVDIKWLHKQASFIDAPILVLSDSAQYDCPLPDNVHYFTYYWWHHQLELIKQWFPHKKTKNITKKFSAICNRITQSKLLVTASLLEIAYQDSIIKLSDWEGQDSRLKTGNVQLDDIVDNFYNKWFGTIIDLKDTKDFINQQNYSANPWTDVYQCCALHFTNESFHYSYMQDEIGHYNYPGPFITEKTLKCLAGGTGFVPIGQFDTYNKLAELGFQFEYDFDTSFDFDNGNITRLEKIVKLVHFLNNYTAEEIYNFTKTSSEYNQEHVYSNKFYKNCESHNDEIINTILSKFK